MTRLPTRHRGFRAAYLKGMAAFVAGEGLDACPYDDVRKPSGQLSWSRAFRNVWRDGWQAAAEDRQQALITLQYAKP